MGEAVSQVVTCRISAKFESETAYDPAEVGVRSGVEQARFDGVKSRRFSREDRSVTWGAWMLWIPKKSAPEIPLLNDIFFLHVTA